MPKRLLGRTHVPHNKRTANVPAVRMDPPAEVLIPMSMHIGAPCTPTVRPGDAVRRGQVIGEATGYVSAPIHASVSGTVKGIENLLTASGRTVPAVRIVSDGKMELSPDCTPPVITDFDSFRAAVLASGLVGLGGAGFPTAVKFDAEKKGLLHHVVINGAECEPYITSDTRTMLDRAEDIAAGVSLLMQYLSAEDYVIGIEKNKPDAIRKMQQTFAGNARVRVVPLPQTYPQGGEKILIYNTLGLTVPEGKLPADVGCVVMNVTSLAFLGKYVRDGIPLVEKCVTVDGSAVEEGKNLIVPIGTSVADVLTAAGVDAAGAGKILLGGPMMGSAIYALTDPILKNTNAVTVLSPADAKAEESLPCIRCGRCVENCPMGLIPTRFTTIMELPDEADRMARLEDAKIGLCMECGCCSFVCPSSRPLVQVNRLAKADLRAYKARMAELNQ